MKKQSKTLEFLEKAQKDPKLSARIEAAVERGGKLTGEEVLQIAQEFGYSFTRDEFEGEVRRNIAERFAAGEANLADVAGARKPAKPLESSCAKGCLSYTKSWHPPREILAASKK
jgi:predicted ribosomally synthesized peptide with nif11-like leader